MVLCHFKRNHSYISSLVFVNVELTVQHMAKKKLRDASKSTKRRAGQLGHTVTTVISRRAGQLGHTLTSQTGWSARHSVTTVHLQTGWSARAHTDQSDGLVS